MNILQCNFTENTFLYKHMLFESSVFDIWSIVWCLAITNSGTLYSNSRKIGVWCLNWMPKMNKYCWSRSLENKKEIENPLRMRRIIDETLYPWIHWLKFIAENSGMVSYYFDITDNIRCHKLLYFFILDAWLWVQQEEIVCLLLLLENWNFCTG